jgi:hypothetical protein
MAILVISPTRRFWVFATMLVAALALAPVCRAQGGDESVGGGKKKPSAQSPASTSKPASPSPQSEKDKLKDEGKKLFNTPAPGGDAADAGAKGWAVVIAAFKGEGHEQQAATMLDKIQKEGGLPEAYIAHRRDAIIIAVGDFPTPEDERAQKELARVQSMEVGREGIKPYASAMLAPPLDWKMEGSLPQFNLASARKLYPDALYTLQVGVYERGDLRFPSEADLKEVRKAAEEAAVKLRQEGELAFYYHGPTMSMVTVGVFDASDFDPQVPGYNSPRLRDAKKRNPYNLDNGKGILVKVKGMKEPQLQPSGLVEIPKR